MAEKQLAISFAAVGSELLSGDVAETNARWLQQQLRLRPAQMVEVRVLSDNKTQMIRAFKELLQISDVLVITGGLGPTEDDMTREVLAESLNLPLEYHPECWDFICEFFKKRGKEIAESNRKQAYFPKGAMVVPNHHGTAPGIYMELNNNKRIFVCPGVPTEFYPMIQNSLLGSLAKNTSEPFKLRLFGIGESALSDLLTEKNIIPQALEWGTIAAKDGVLMRFSHESALHPDFENCINKLRQELAPWIYSEGEQKPLDLAIELLKKENFKLSLAESCTGGLLGSWFSEKSGSSSWFLGGVMAYANEIKENILAVPHTILESQGVVSQACAEAMSRGAQKNFGSDMALAITGIAGPTGGEPQKPVGTVWIAALGPDGKMLSRCYHFSGDRDEVRERACHAACLLLLENRGQLNKTRAPLKS